MVTTHRRVALITGGVSGMGFAVAEALSSRGNWDIHLVDLNPNGATAAASLPATFHQANVTSYNSLASVFKSIFQTTSRIDFVFANAGIAEKTNFYEKHDTGIEPPPEFNLQCVNICLDAVITTSYLALHYFRLSPSGDGVDKTLIMTASCGGIYPSYYSPTYSAAKHGVVGFMRSIAKSFWKHDGIRVNAICPGVVKTNLLTAKEWENFPDEFFTPVKKIVESVLVLLDGVDRVTGNRIDEVEGGKENASAGKDGVLWGEAVEISGENHYYRDTPRVCDDAMRAVMRATDIQELKH